MAARSFHVAAHELGYTQSAISQQIATLERAVGFRLIRRAARGRPLSVTPAGECLTRLHRTLESAFGAARQDIEERAAGKTSVLRFACAFALPQLPGAVIAMRSQYPEVAVEVVRPADEDEVVTLLASGALDVAVVRSCTDVSLGDAVASVSSPYVCVAPPLSRLAQARGAVALSDLKRYPRIATADGTAFATDVQAAIIAADIEMLVDFVAGGLGVGVVPALLARRTRRVARRPLRENVPAFGINLVCAGTRSQAAATLLSLLASTLRGSRRR